MPGSESADRLFIGGRVLPAGIDGPESSPVVTPGSEGVKRTDPTDRFVVVTAVSAVSTNEVLVTASVEGAGPTLVVIHPGGQTAESWRYVAQELAVDFQVVCLRRRIYVTGVATPRDHSMTIEVADATAIATLFAEPILLVGHSSGAVVALETALANPGRFAGVVAYEPPMPTTSLVGGPALTRARQALDDGDLVEAMRVHLVEIVQMPAQAVDGMLSDPKGATALTEYAAAQIADTEAIDSLGIGIDRYRPLPIPVTLIEGELSPTHLRTRVADLAATLPNARVMTLPDQGHTAHLDAPDVLAEAIRRATHAS
jgi:pimeloyl-ACP methyl ester carboxylesterase